MDWKISGLHLSICRYPCEIPYDFCQLQSRYTCAIYRIRSSALHLVHSLARTALRPNFKSWEMGVTYLDIDRFNTTPLKTDPYDYIVVENFLKQDKFKDIIEDFPKVPGAGSHPPSALKIKGNFRGLLDELQGPDFRKAVEQKFNIDLTGRPTMYTVRGFVRKKDGSIHTDSKTKIITVLIYLNNDWDEDGGRLRILRNGTDLENYTDEVSPVNGTLLVFRRSDTSWHGHHPHEGQRRAIQMNWVLNEDVVRTEQGRHFVSTYLKWFKNLFQ